jgi:TonB-dependent starch-binding outer membrane protein SusC
MKSKFTWIFTLLLAFFVQFAFAQQKTVTGVITDSDGLAVPGVTVMVKGDAASAVVTDIDGKYSIQATEGQTLVFTYVNTVKEQRVGAEATVNVVMAEVLDELVIGGYASFSKKKSAVSAVTIDAKAIESRPNISFVQSLQGRIPGLQISTGSGSPGSSNTTTILRGLGSLNGNTEPLYVIDNVPSNLINFRSINANDIESVTVLKDAGATSIYGNRGANGVIVVKTKRGDYDKGLQVRYSGVTGFTTLQEHNYDIMSGQQLLTLERLKSVGTGAGMTDAQIAAAPNTNWEDYFFQTGVSQDHNLSFTMGGKNTNSFTSIGYFEQEGIVPSTDIKRISVRSNFGGKSNNNKFTYTTNLYGGYSRRYQLEQETRTDIDGNVLQNPLQGMLSSLPYLDPNEYQNGRQLFEDYGQPSFGITPYMLMDYIGNIYNRFDEVKLLFNGSATYNITDDLSVGVTGGIDYTSAERVFSRLPQSYLAIISAESAGYPDYPGLETQSFSRDFGFNGNTKINYNHTFGTEGKEHTIDASLFTEYYRAHSKGNGFTVTGLNSRTYSPGAGTGYVPFNPATPNLFRPTISASEARAGLFSYFGLFDYDYNSKYGATVSVRRDASYRFEEENQWGTFWSASARWNLDQESFIQDASWINELKLRGSIGTAGNQNIAGSSIYDGPNITRTLYATTSGYNNQPGIVVSQIANPVAMWETVEQANIGVDFVFFRKLRGTVDVYRKYTKDLYQTYPVSAINGTTGFLANVGAMENRGVELMLAYDVVSTDDFRFSVNANGSYNKNELKDMPGDGFQYLGDLQIQANDQVAFQYTTVQYAGVNPVNGNSLFYRADGSLTETPTLDDRVNTGKSPIPVYQGAFGFEADYKGFFASAQFTFVADVWRFDYDFDNLMDPTSIGIFPISQDMDRAWTPENRNTDVPSIYATNTDSESLSDRFLRDSSYLRLKYASVGYNVPTDFLSKTFISSARIYAQAENFLTWSKWRGFDPESNAASTFGGYPTPRVFSFGVDVSF